jgi:hypothetical protein
MKNLCSSSGVEAVRFSQGKIWASMKRTGQGGGAVRA